MIGNRYVPYASLRTHADTQALEAYGIFSIGEIIGRRNLVGYKLKE
jgi:hypothetical protein